MSSEDPQLLTAEPTFFARNPWRQGLFLAVLSLCLNLVGNGKVGLWDRDEPRYAGAVREMRQSGDWIVPQFNDAPRYHKPILVYWLMRVGTAIGGDNTFGARLSSSVTTSATSLVVWSLARGMIGPAWGFLAALMYATAPIVVAEAKLATTDAALALFLISAQACLWGLMKAPSKRLAAGFWVLLSLAVLTKGPIGPALLFMSGLMCWWFHGSVDCWKRLHWRWGVPTFLALTLPWYLAVGILTNWDYYRFALGNQVINRISTGMEEHGGFPGYYVVFSLVTFHPWSAFVPPALFAAWTRRKTSRDLAFLLGWAIGPLILLEIVKTKLIHYYLPAFPALAILGAWFLQQVASSDLLTIRRWKLGRLALALLGGVGISAGVGMLAALAILPSDMAAGVVTLSVVILAGTLYALLKLHRGETIFAVRGLVATWALAMTLLGGWVLPSGEPYRLSRLVGQRLATLSEKYQAKPVVVTYQEPGIIYALGRPAPTMRNWELGYQLLLKNETLIAPMFPNQIASMQKDSRFDIEVVDTLDGFNINKGQPHYLKFARIRLQPELASKLKADGVRVIR